MKIILLLEDNPNDVELILRALRGVVLVCPVHARGDYVTALIENSFDMIVCDLNVHTFLEFETVTLAKAKQPNTPLIVLTGSLSPIQAQQSLLKGAHYIVMKNGFREDLKVIIKQILKLP